MLSPEWLSLIAGGVGSLCGGISTFAVMKYRVDRQEEALAELHEIVQENKRDIEHRLDEYRDGTDKKLDELRTEVSKIAVGVARIEGKMEKQ